MKIFLSSTYLDLIEHRKAVVNSLRTMGEEVEHMEIFGAREEEPTKASLEELDKCDVLVGVYAYRYGTVPKNTNASVTEQEYLYAIKKGIPILVFVVDENHAWPPKSMDKSLTKINKFKSQAKKEHTADYFTFPDTLAAKVVAAVGRLAKKINPKPTSTHPSITEPRKLSVGSTLPSQPFFFGRENELAIIADAISPESRTWGALIHGPGGIGKTALAIEAAHRAPAMLFPIKIYISAKERELTSKGEVSSKDFSHNNFLSILNELALILGEEGILRLPPDERVRALRIALSKNKTLIIFDNLETLKEEDRSQIFQFLSRLPQENKAIVTSRRRDETDARTILLDQLQETEAEELIFELAKRNPKVHKLDDLDKRELYYSASGNPLIIRWIIGQIGRDGSNIQTIASAIEFLRQAPPDNDPLEYVFGDLFNSLSPSEKKVLAAMTYFGNAPKSEWIAKIIGFKKKDDVELVWDDLVKRSILAANKVNDLVFLPALTGQFVKNKLPLEINAAGEGLKEYSFEIALEFGARKNRHGLTNLAEKWPVISSSIPYIVRHDDNILQFLCDTLDLFLQSSGLWDEWLWLNQQAEVVAQLNYDYDSAGERAYRIGVIYNHLEKPNEILQYATRVEKHWKEFKTAKLSAKGQILADHLRGLSYKLNANYQKATELIQNALELLNETDPNGATIKAVLLNTLAEIQVKEGETGNRQEKFIEAEKHFKEAALIASLNDYKEGIAIYKANLANLKLKQRKWLEAEKLASDALILSEELGLQEEIARDNFYLAIMYLNMNDGAPRGLNCSQKAVDIYKRLRHKNLPDAEAILQEWEK